MYWAGVCEILEDSSLYRNKADIEYMRVSPNPPKDDFGDSP